MKFLKKLLVLGVLAILLGLVVNSSSKSSPENKYFPTAIPVIEPKTAFPSSDSFVPLFHFAVFSDIHSDLKNLKKAVLTARNDKMNFIIVTGDLTTIGEEKELTAVKGLLNEGKILYYVVPGNHDIWLSRKNEKNIFKEVFSQDFQSFTKDGFKFILLNNADDNLGVAGVKNKLGESQDKWLEKEISDCLVMYCFVFAHKPFAYPSSGHIMGEEKLETQNEAKTIVELLENNNIHNLFFGHLHSNHSYQLGSMEAIIIGAVAEERNPQGPRFLEVEAQKSMLGQKKIVWKDINLAQ